MLGRTERTKEMIVNQGEKTVPTNVGLVTAF